VTNKNKTRAKDVLPNVNRTSSHSTTPQITMHCQWAHDSDSFSCLQKFLSPCIPVTQSPSQRWNDAVCSMTLFAARVQCPVTPGGDEMDASAAVQHHLERTRYAFSMGGKPQKLPLPFWRSAPPCNAWFPGPTAVFMQNGMSIG